MTQKYFSKFVLAGLCVATLVLGTSAQMPNPYGAPITLEQAKKVAAPALAEAAKNNWNMAVAIVDPSGNMVKCASSRRLGFLQEKRSQPPGGGPGMLVGGAFQAGGIARCYIWCRALGQGLGSRGAFDVPGHEHRPNQSSLARHGASAVALYARKHGQH